MKSENKFVVAYDPKIRRRVLFAIKEGYIVSLVTGHKIKYPSHVHQWRMKAKIKPARNNKNFDVVMLSEYCKECGRIRVAEKIEISWGIYFEAKKRHLKKWGWLK